jgi:hypothetical protein
VISSGEVFIEGSNIPPPNGLVSLISLSASVAAQVAVFERPFAASERVHTAVTLLVSGKIMWMLAEVEQNKSYMC